MYILQESLFSFEELQILESKEKLPIFFSALDLRPYAKQLKSSSPQGAEGHCREGILRALIAAPLEKIDTFTELHNRLKNDVRFRYQCGLDISRPAPSISTLSRVFSALTRKGLAKQIFHDLVSIAQDKGIIDGSHQAIDSAAIDAYEKKRPKKRCEHTGNANWGAKFDSFGNKITWFGYKMHLSVDTKSELPMAIEVTPAHMNDGDVAPQLIEQVNQCVKTKIEYLIMDAGYDQLKNYESAKNIGAQAIIPLNLRNEKEPPAGIASNGTPRCSMGYKMTYWGSEKNQLKFRCPHATGKVDCPLGMTACSSSNYGMVVKVNTLKDIRRYSTPHRDTKRWKELYNERTSVERCNSRMKSYLTANSLHIRGIEKVKTHIYLNAIVLIASALAMNKQSRKQIAI